MKFKLKNILMISFLAIAGLFSVSSTLLTKHVEENNVVEKAEATTSSHKYTSLQAVDEIGFTWDAGGDNKADLKIHIYYIHIDPVCVFKTTNETNATKAELDAMNSGAGLGWQINNDASADFYGNFYWYKDGDITRRSYLFDFPWYITGFTYQYYNTKGKYTVSTQNIYDWQEYRGDFIYNTYDYAQFSTREGTQRAVYTDVPLYTLTFNSKGGSEVESQELLQYQKSVEPDDPTRSSYTFNKWTAIDSIDESEYSFGTSTLTDDTTLYAQWTPTNPTVYFVNGHSWATPYVHYWGGVGEGTTFPGNKMSATDAKLHCKVGDTWYNITIYQYTISGSPAHLKFSNGTSGTETGNLDVEHGGIYWYGVTAETFSQVASYLISFMNSMGSYTYNGQTYSKSICSFSSSTASSLVSQYNTLSSSATSDVVTSINNSSINTYATPVTSPSSTTDTSIPVLIAQINKNTSNGVYGTVRNFSPFILTGEDGNVLPTAIIITASSIALLSITALSVLVIKKRKRKEE